MLAIVDGRLAYVQKGRLGRQILHDHAGKASIRRLSDTMLMATSVPVCEFQVLVDPGPRLLEYLFAQFSGGYHYLPIAFTGEQITIHVHVIETVIEAHLLGLPECLQERPMIPEADIS